MALLALALGAVGLGGLLWTLADQVTAASRVGDGTWVAEQVARFSTAALVGLPMWLLHWRPAPAGGAAERRALPRRLYVYLSLLGSMLALLGSAATALYRLLALALGAAPGIDLFTDLGHALAVAVVAALVALYHGRILRADTRQHVPGVAVAAEPLPASVLLRVRTADSSQIQELRARGVDVELVEQPLR